MLFNKAAVNRLEREIKEQEQISIELQTKIDGTKVAIDSLEKVLHELNTNTNR
jgi:ferritin-like metal-binding protein YciE